MPRSIATTVDNSFVKGLITEATGLNFPENACTETSNCIFQHTGEVSRRLGLDYENDFVLNTIDPEDNAIREFLWKSIAQNGEVTFVVLQIGNVLSFYSVEDTAISSTKKSFEVNLNSFKVAGSPSVNSIACSFDSGNGYLFVSHPYCDPFYISYDIDADDITSTTINVTIRDFEGLDDNLEDSERPATLTKEHHYNLLNQGWSVNTVCSEDALTWTVESPLQHWAAAAGGYARADFPSNCDIWWTYKRPMRSSAGFEKPLESFSMIEVQNVDKMGNTLAPKGHYIFNAWNIDRAAVSYSSTDVQTSLTGIDTVTSGFQRPSQVAFFSSRVFYAGVSSSLFNTKIYFSKIIERVNDFGRCFQANDPTTETAGDLLPSDGGIIVIPAIAKIIKMQQVGSALFIFATNGVWKIEGSQGVGFAANDYSVTKVSPIGALSDTSFVDVEGSPMWWNNDGIWTVQSDSTGSAAQVTSLSFTSIQSFVNDISNNTKRYIKGIYNPLEKTVQWLYRTTEAGPIKERYQYDGILNLSLVNQSFYPWSISTTDNFISGILVVQGIASSTALENVVDDVDAIVTTDGSESVTVSATSNNDVSTIFKYIVTTSDDTLTFGEFVSTDYLDWGSDNRDEDYVSHFVTGYKLHGDAIKKFQPNYIQMYTRNDVSSQFEYQIRWDYAISDITGRWSNKQTYVVNDLNYGFRTKRFKNRGHGKALQYKINSIEGKPFNIIGWSSMESSNSNA